MSPSFYLSPKGRVSRSELWLKFHLPMVCIAILTGLLDVFVFGTYDEGSGFSPISSVFLLLIFWPSIAISIKRLHDRDKSGWFYLLNMVPLINIWVWVEMYILGGTEGENQFGPDPRTETLQNTASLAQ